MASVRFRELEKSQRNNPFLMTRIRTSCSLRQIHNVAGQPAPFLVAIPK